MTDLIQEVIDRKRDSERLFCASVFVNPNSAKHALGWLTPDMIHDERCRVFWREVLAGKTAIESALQAEIYYDLLKWQNEIVSSLEYETFARRIADDGYFLNVAMLAPDLWKGIHGQDADMIRQALELIANLRPISGDEIPDAVDVALDFNVAIDTPEQSIQTHIRPLDSAIGGFDRQALHIIAARPSMGKTALAFQIARNIASNKSKVIFFSLEMSRRALWARAACGALGISWRDVKAGNVSDADKERVKKQSMELAQIYEDRLLIDDSSMNSMDSIWKKTARYRPDVIVVDHIGLVKGQPANESIIKWLGRVTWAGKQLAKEFDLGTIMLAQLNRGVENRADKRPALIDLRDSGEIEQNADTVLFLHRADYYENEHQNTNKSKTEVIVSKFRDGARQQKVELHYDLSRQWFYAEDELNIPF